jgi:hypothetical protein
MPAATNSVQRLRALLGALAFSLLLSLALASCSSSATGSSGSSATTRSTGVTSTTATANEQTECALLSASEVGSTMGVTVGPPNPLVHGAVTTCTYKAAVLAQSVIIEYDISASSATFATDRSKIESHHVVTTSVPGLGSEAYSFSESSGSNTVNTVVTLQGTLQTIVTGTSSLTQVQTLAEEILYKIDAHNSTTSTIPTTPTG